LSLGKPVTNVGDLDIFFRFRSFYEDNKSLNSCNAIASLGFALAEKGVKVLVKFNRSMINADLGQE